MTAERAPLSNNRWHFGHGPIDLVIDADGEPGAVQSAHDAAWARFETILPELVAELPLLRARVREHCALRGPVARRMWQACHPLRSVFVTPMAAVAGSVAEEVIQAYRRPGVRRAWVNNGGDIALHLAPGESVRVGLAPAQQGGGKASAIALDAAFTVHASMAVRGVATSGWRGRSFSLGIADSVTVLAATASQADAAATIIANAVDVLDTRIVRRPACELKDDTDLGELSVTVDVPALGEGAVRAALASGLRGARQLRGLGLVHSAVLACQGRIVTTEVDGARQVGCAAVRARAQGGCDEIALAVHA